jgi:nitroreductase
MKKLENTASRRRFFRRGLVLGGGLLAVPPSHAAPANETLKTIHSLRSIHGDFSDKQVPDESVQAILDASVRAANASNSQTYSIIVSRDPAKIQKLTGYRGSCLLLYCSDHTRLADAAKHLGDPFTPVDTESFVTSSTNTILAAQTAVIAAKSMGIDSLLTNGVHRGDMERVWEILELPQESCFPLIALILGYPTTEPAYRTGRLRGPGVVHYEKFHRLSKDELEDMVRQYDDRTLHIGLNDDWRQKGHRHYLDWYYKEWTGRLKPPSGESTFFKRLKKSGFIDGQRA